MTKTTQVFISLIAGLVGGAMLSAYGGTAGEALGKGVEPIGVLWLNALRMTVIPLVVSLLITGIGAAAETARASHLAFRIVVTFAILLVFAGVVGTAVAWIAFEMFPVDGRLASALRAGSSAADPAATSVPTATEWIARIIPTNPFESAATGSLLPLVVFALFFGLAATRIRPDLRATVRSFFEAVSETMQMIVAWVLWAAPLGVFALALGVGISGGLHAAGALGHYLVVECIVGIAITLIFYPVAQFAGGVGMQRFARAVAPAQAVALSTQSSLATLPAMLVSAREQLGVSSTTASIVLPLAVSLFRISSAPMNMVIVFFIAQVYGIELSAGIIALGLGVALLNSLAVVGLPAQTTFFSSSALIAMVMGLPLELLPLLLAVEVIPDLFRTLSNVTADIAATTVLGKRDIATD